MMRLLRRLRRRSPSTSLPVGTYQDLTSTDHFNGYRNAVRGHSMRSTDNFTGPARPRELFDDLLQMGRQPAGH